MTDKPTKRDWLDLASKEMRGGDPESLVWQTPEGIPVQPLYTAEDMESVTHLGSLPGFEPFLRGPKATMYAGRPWTIRQYAGFSTAEEDTTQTIRASLVTWARQVSRLIVSKT